MSDKLAFLSKVYPSLLRNLDPSTKALWGKMNVQEMIEHMADSVREANGKILREIMTPEANLLKMKEFLMSEKEFRPNTKNALMGDEPFPVRNASVSEAINELESELKDFEKLYSSNPVTVITNPFFWKSEF